MRTLRRALAALWFAAVATVVALVVFSHVAPRLGHEPLIIRGRSMEPTIPLGSLAIASRVHPQAVEAGDVVSIRLPSRVLVTHRVIRVAENGPERLLEMQGDANADPDGALIPARWTVGVVDRYVPFAGYLMALLSMPSGVITLFTLLATLLMVVWLLEELEKDGGESSVLPEAPDALAA